MTCSGRLASLFVCLLPPAKRHRLPAINVGEPGTRRDEYETRVQSAFEPEQRIEHRQF
jgi:hypothetical protein